MMPMLIQRALKTALRRFASKPVHFRIVVQTAAELHAPVVVLNVTAAEIVRMTQPGTVISVEEDGVRVAELVL